MFNAKKDYSGQSNLNVATEYNQAVGVMKDAGSKLKALPQNPYGKKVDIGVNIDARMNKVGANAGTDYSMFLLAGMQNAVMSVLTGGVMGPAADVATAMIGDGANEQKTRYTPVDPTLKQGQKTSQVLKPKNVRSKTPMKANGAMATTMLMNASKRTQKKAYDNTKIKRRQLERQMTEAESLAQTMQFYKRADVYDIFDAPEAYGNKTQGKKDGQHRLANPEAVKKLDKHQMYKPYFARPAARPALGM